LVYSKAVKLETDSEKKTYKPSSEYLKEIEGVFDRSEKALNNSSQVSNSNIINDTPRSIIQKPAGIINTSDNSTQKPEASFLASDIDFPITSLS
jgi:hypothetical protein